MLDERLEEAFRQLRGLLPEPALARVAVDRRIDHRADDVLAGEAVGAVLRHPADGQPACAESLRLVAPRGEITAAGIDSHSAPPGGHPEIGRGSCWERGGK